MVFYPKLKWIYRPVERTRVVQNIINLRKQISKEIPKKTVKDTLLLASWNIRDFDSNKFKHGPRLKESYYYIAEILSAFDVIALQEINENLKALYKVMSIMGRNWDFIATDTTEGSSGNNERMVFLYDKGKVSFRDIAGEIVLPASKLIEGERQFARTPFVVAFQSGWFKFMLCTVHIYYGSDTGTKLNRRIKEIEGIVKFLSKRADDSKDNYIVLGDFNIVHPEHKTMEALLKRGFIVPDKLRKPSNIGQDKYYDQIAFKVNENELKLGDSKENAGVFNYYKSVFKNDDFSTYRSEMNPEKRDSYKPGETQYYENVWRTFQMSDHLPMWAELKIDFSEDYLNKLL